MILLAGIVTAVAVWDVTRTIGARRDDPELQEGALVFGTAAALVGVLAVTAVDPPVLVLGGETIQPSTEAVVRWAFRHGVTAMIVAAPVLAMLEGALFGTDRIAEETTLLRYALQPEARQEAIQ
ncbi:MAG: hypothetical protein RI560_08690 [Natronomonas sp.]|nr:hypothetical protein [Natronomonas sp.]